MKSCCLCFTIQFKKKKKKTVPWKAHKAHLDNISEPGHAFLFLKLHIPLPLPLKNHHQVKTQGSYSFLFLFCILPSTDFSGSYTRSREIGPSNKSR